MRNTLGGITSCLFLITMLLPASLQAKKQDEQPLPVLQTISTEGFPEPSGICYVPESDTFFLVGDEGHIAEMSPRGEFIRIVYLGNHDLEGITWDPNEKSLLLLAEDKDLIIVLNPSNFSIKQTISIPRTAAGTDKVLTGGFEGAVLTAPGTLCLVNQIRKPGKKQSGILILDNIYTAPAARYLPTGISDQAAVSFDPENGELYIISDKQNTLYRFTLEGDETARYSLPGKDQEGIAPGTQNNLYITQDSGGILVIGRPDADRP